MLPGTPGIPTAHDNKPGYLILQWEEGANGNAPIDKFELQYRKGNTHKISITTQKLLVDHSSFIIRITCFWIIEYVGLYMFWCFQVMVVWSRSVRFVRTKSGTMVRWWFISRSPWKLMTLTGFVCVPSQRLGLPVGVDGRNPSNQVVICYLLYSERLVDFSLDYHLIFLLLYSWRRTVGISTSDLFVERKELSSLFARWWTHSVFTTDESSYPDETRNVICDSLDYGSGTRTLFSRENLYITALRHILLPMVLHSFFYFLTYSKCDRGFEASIWRNLVHFRHDYRFSHSRYRHYCMLLEMPTQ